MKNENRRGFERQIDYMRTFGEFISIDEAVSILKRGDPDLCVTLDDGFKDGYTNAFPILSEKGVPAKAVGVTRFRGHLNSWDERTQEAWPSVVCQGVWNRAVHILSGRSSDLLHATEAPTRTEFPCGRDSAGTS